MKLRQAVKGIGVVGAFWAFLWGTVAHFNETIMILLAVGALVISWYLFMLAATE